VRQVIVQYGAQDCEYRPGFADGAEEEQGFEGAEQGARS
jgi:hypothetical protein